MYYSRRAFLSKQPVSRLPAHAACSHPRAQARCPFRNASDRARVIARAVDEDEQASDAPQVDLDLQLPREVIQRLKDVVFGFDTFFVTKTENYDANGVLFNGNLRGNPSESFAKMQRRLKAELGDKYSLFLLRNTEEKPVVVLLPNAAIEEPDNSAAQTALAALCLAVTLVTTVSAFGVPVFDAVLTGNISALQQPEVWQAAVPGATLTLAILLVHEFGHAWQAQQVGATLRLPFLLPAGIGILGTFGGVTRFGGVVQNREALLRVAAAGPLAGSTASLVSIVAGLILSSSQVGPLVQVENTAFNDCFLMGLLGQLTFGDALYSFDTITVSPVLLAGWAGLVVNGLNLIPMGELDGGRIVHAIGGRRAARRATVVLLLVLGLAGILDTLALYWFLLIIVLQRGPIAPQADEVTEADGVWQSVGYGLLGLSLLALLPYPMDVSQAPGIM